MKLYRIWAIALRHLLLTTRAIHKITDLFYWPTLDFIIWGLVSEWNRIQNPDSIFATQLMISVFLWQVCLRATMEVTVGIVEEFWSKNLLNLCVTPLKVSEWACGIMLVSIFKIAVLIPYTSAITYFLFGINVFSIGWYLVPFITMLIIFGWSIGFLAISFIIRWGQSVESFAWSIGWLFGPLSAAFAPLEVYPSLVRKISLCIPATYAFEMTRAVAIGAQYPAYYMVIGLLLSIAYLIASLTFFVYMLNQSRARGLARL